MERRWTGERIMKAILDVLIQGEQFEDNARPSWLRSPNRDTRGKLELDRYYPRLRLAFEFQGEQHQTYVPGMQASPNDFFLQQWKDDRKARICRDKGIILVPVYRATLEVNELKRTLRQTLFPHLRSKAEALWEQWHDKLLVLEEIAADYRRKKVKKRTKEPLPAKALEKPHGLRPGMWWQDKDGVLREKPKPPPRVRKPPPPTKIEWYPVQRMTAHLDTPKEP